MLINSKKELSRIQLWVLSLAVVLDTSRPHGGKNESRSDTRGEAAAASGARVVEVPAGQAEPAQAAALTKHSAAYTKRSTASYTTYRTDGVS